MDFRFWKEDLKSSLVIFLIALPLCLGIALASNAPLSSGLIAGILGGIVVGLFSHSNMSVSGPAAGLAVVVSSSISDLGSFNAFTLSVFFAGIIQIIFSFLNGGRIGDFFPSSVVKGMLAAIGLILILKQVPHAIGYDADYFGDESFFQLDGQNTFSEILQAIRGIHLGSTLIAIMTILVIVSWEKIITKKLLFTKNIPGPLVAVLIAITANYIFKISNNELEILNKHLVQLPFSGGIGDFLYTIVTPEWSYLSSPKVYSTAIIIAIIASVETLLSIEAADKLDDLGRLTSKKRELLAQGIGNILSGLLGGLPIISVVIRTSANVSAGARTKLSTVLHGMMLLFSLIFIPEFLNLIPLSCLAGILILVGLNLVKPKMVRNIYNRGNNQFVPFIVTVFAILFTDLWSGILIGMSVGFFYAIKSNIHKSIVMVNDGDHYLIRFYKDVSFLQKSLLLKMFHEIPENSHLVIDGSKGVFVDEDISEAIEDFIKKSEVKKIRVELKKSTLALSPIFKV